MDVFIHVDESGPFDEKLSGNSASVVGGVCSLMDSDAWGLAHRTHLAGLNEGQPPWLCFAYPDHYHCGHLLSRKIDGPARASKSELQSFTHAVFENVLEKSLFGFLSKNRGKRFEYSPQATYVMNLVAALRHGLERLEVIAGNSVSRLTIVIAQRTIDETTKGESGKKYMPALLGFVGDQLRVGEGSGVDLARRLYGKQSLILASGVGTQDSGLIGADFVCCLGRYGKKSQGEPPLHICQPDPELLLGDYRHFHERQVAELLRHGYYGNCLEFICRVFPLTEGVPDISALISRLGKETDAVVLERELPVLLAVIHSLAKRRTEMPHALTSAAHTAERLAAVAEKQVEKASSNNSKRMWVNLQIQALAELAACHNHIGAVGPQAEAEARLKTLLEANKRETGLDASHRRTLLLDVRNRNLNLLFNDYRFEEAYTLAEELADARLAMTGGEEPDELMGQILGSKGQACAFMGRWEPAWNCEAEELFTQSLQHFAPDSVQEQMSRNFTVTLLWQAGRFLQALAALPPVLGWISTDDPATSLVSRLLVPKPEQRAFDIVNCLRILAGLGGTGDVAALVESCLILENVGDTVGTDHPYEQWWKWLGIIHMQLGDLEAADRCLARAEALCARHSFTMKTIGNSATLLRVNVAARRKAKGERDRLHKKFCEDIDNLCRQSSSFSDYLRLSGGAELSIGIQN